MQENRILFVCLGNICRSPAAEAILNTLLEQHPPGDGFLCDSAGTTDWNIGSPPDSTMQHHAGRRGYRLSGASRQFDPARDFPLFDYILTMDNTNYADVRALARTPEEIAKVHRITDFCQGPAPQEVPDPYRGGAGVFERVLDILEDACGGLLEHLLPSRKDPARAPVMSPGLS